MLISLESAEKLFNVTSDTLYANPAYSKYIITQAKKGSAKFDIDSFNKNFINKQNEINFRIDVVNFAEHIIEIIGETNFYKKIPTLRRQETKRGIEQSKFSLSIATLIKEIFKEYYSSYEVGLEIKPEYIALENRVPLTSEFIIDKYWQEKKTTLEIAKELNVPKGWIIKEIKRLGLKKKRMG